MLQLEGVVVGPRVAQVGVERDGAVAPRARLLLLAVAPEEARDGDDDVRVVIARLVRVRVRVGVRVRVRVGVRVRVRVGVRVRVRVTMQRPFSSCSWSCSPG